MEARLSPQERLAGESVWRDGVCEIHSLGRIAYRDAWKLQNDWVERRRAQEIPDRLVFLEHPPVITLGRNARPEHVLSDRAELERAGIELVETNRGGDVTFHGPGQLIGYPILDLARIRKDVVWYVRMLEEAMIRAIDDLGVAAGRRPGCTGVWIGEAKVAAIGIHISRWITSHGFALNVNTDLDYFRHIVPCGIADHPVTSLAAVLGSTVDRTLLERRLAEQLGAVLDLEMQWVQHPDQERRESCPPPTC
jgi:lipoyl(octanoyl) transferase